MDRTRRRNPIISFLLSIIWPGLGHVYNGQPLKGILFFFALWFFLFALGLSGLVYSMLGLILLIAAGAVGPIAIAIHAAIEAARLKVVHLKWYNRWYVYVCALLLAHLASAPVVLFVQHQVEGLRAFKVPSVSMAPTLNPGDHFLAKLERYGLRLPQRGDIVIFPFPEDRSKTFVQRIVGLPGERIQIKDKVVFINGCRLEDPWGVHFDRNSLSGDITPGDNFGPVNVPQGAVMVLGDNREFSYDSRFWGLVEIKDIEGKALFIYWSDDRNRIGKQLQ